MTVYRSGGRRGHRRGRRLLAGALAALILMLCAGAVTFVLTRGGGTPAASRPASSPSASPIAVHTTSLARVTVRSGGRATLGYRVDGPRGTTWTVTLVVRRPSGRVVLSRRLETPAPAGVERAVILLVKLPAGRYSYLAHARDPAGHTETGATPARLIVMGPLAPGFPGKKATSAALAWAAGRAGQVGVAVVDTNGVASGYRQHVTFQAASLAKAILLAAYLRSHPSPDPALDAVATTMIEKSDNASAYSIFSVVGTKGMREIAKLAGMRDYEQGEGWIDTRVSASDEALLFFHYLEYVPASRRTFARQLLSSIIPIQRWGIPAAAGPAGWKTYFKGGWLGLDNKLMVQAAWLVKGNQTWALAVMSDDNPDRSYGWDTQKGVTGLLLGEQPTPAYLGPVLEP